MLELPTDTQEVVDAQGGMVDDKVIFSNTQTSFPRTGNPFPW